MARGETVGSEHSLPFLLAQQELTSLLACSCILLPAHTSTDKVNVLLPAHTSTDKVNVLRPI